MHAPHVCAHTNLNKRAQTDTHTYVYANIRTHTQSHKQTHVGMRSSTEGIHPRSPPLKPPFLPPKPPFLPPPYLPPPYLPPPYFPPPQDSLRGSPSANHWDHSDSLISSSIPQCRTWNWPCRSSGSQSRNSKSRCRYPGRGRPPQGQSVALTERGPP